MADFMLEARALAEALGDQRRLGFVSAYSVSSFRVRGDYQQAIESGQRALAIAARLGDFALQVTANFYLGQHYYVLGEYGHAIGFLRENVESLQGDRVRERFGMGAFPDPFEVEKADEYYRQAMALAEELGMRPLKAHCHLGLGELYSKMGSREHARVELSTALELYRSMGMTLWLNRAEAALSR